MLFPRKSKFLSHHITYAFFGAERMLFGTDYPYDAERGDTFTRDTIAAIDGMTISDGDKKMIFADNALCLLNLR